MQTNTSASPAAGPAPQVPGTDPEALTVGARVGRIIGVLVSPVKTFQSIARKPSWLAPLVLWVLAAGVTSAIVTPKMDFQAMMRQRMAQRGVVMSDQQMQQAVAIQQRFRWIGEVAAVVMPVIIAGLVSLLFFAAFAAAGLVSLLFFGALAAAGQKSMSYGQSFAVTTHAFVPQSLAGFATAIVAAGMTTINPMALGDLLCSSPACFASGTLAPATHAALQALDIYVIWTLVLMTIGYAAAARVSRTLTGSVVLVVWVLYVIGKVALSGFFG